MPAISLHRVPFVALALVVALAASACSITTDTYDQASTAVVGPDAEGADTEGSDDLEDDARQGADDVTVSDDVDGAIRDATSDPTGQLDGASGEGSAAESPPGAATAPGVSETLVDGSTPDDLAFSDPGPGDGPPSVDSASGDDANGGDEASREGTAAPGNGADGGAVDDSPQASADGAASGTAPGGYGSALLDDATPSEPTGADNDSVDGPDVDGPGQGGGEGAMTGNVSESDLELLAARGAILTEAFGLPGARLMTDVDRRCVLAGFESAHGTSRTNEIIASMVAEPGEVDSLVDALLSCNALPSVADGLIAEVEPLLDERLSPSVVACIADAYGEPQVLAAAMRLALESEAETPESVRASASGPVVDCVGLGDLLAADITGVSEAAKACLNDVGSDVIAELLDLEIRSTPSSIDATQVGALVEQCLLPSEIDLAADD